MTLATAKQVINRNGAHSLAAKRVLKDALTEAVGPLSDTVTTAVAAGIAAGVGTIVKSSVSKVGDVITTEYLLDLTGLSSSTTNLDIIGTAGVSYFGQILAADNGTVLGGTMKCLEVPAGGIDDIDLYSAVEGTGAFDAGVAALTETALVTSGAAWTLGLEKSFLAAPAADEYLYLCGGDAGTAAAYTAGRFQITIKGYDA